MGLSLSLINYMYDIDCMTFIVLFVSIPVRLVSTLLQPYLWYLLHSLYPSVFYQYDEA